MAQDHPSLCAFLCSRLRDEIFSNTLALSPENFQRDAFYYKDTLDDTRNLHGFYFHIYTHTHHARCYRTRARPGCWVMREVRFRLSASKNFMKEKKMCLTHEFLDPLRLSRRFRMFFFLSSFPLSLLLSLSSLSLSTMMIVVARTTRKIFALVGHPPDRVVDIDYVRVRSSKRRNRERERVKGRVSCRFLVEKKKFVHFLA